MTLTGGFAAETNQTLIFPAEQRAGAVIFIDECLTRGITNSMTLDGLREWATNTINRYRLSESKLATNSVVSTKRYTEVLKSDVPEAIRSLRKKISACSFSYASATNTFYTYSPGSDPVKVAFYRGSTGEIEAVSIYWYIYGVIVGPESFRPNWERDPWYHRKLADGVFLWHGYK